MYLIDQHAKKIMEECKERARDAGLVFDDETLEYIVTNTDMIELSPKVMIPTLYDYWVNDVDILKGKGIYKLYPSNPYETVINSRPAISYYNDNNPDWLNIMIFYHVLGHIDFFQNNALFQNTWNDDFVGMALADKRLIASLRSTYGRWVDYVIEFSRSIDNISGYFKALPKYGKIEDMKPSVKIDFYFDYFLQEIVVVSQIEFFKEIERYNKLIEKNKDIAEGVFFSDIIRKYPEFNSKFKKFNQSGKSEKSHDLLEFIRDNSPFLRNENNSWMKSVMTIIRNTALYFEPQIRSKIINEGWASYWHDTLFRSDDRIKGHESSFAKINAMVTSIQRVGLNPYAIGLRLIQHIEEMGNKGKMSYNFQKIKDSDTRKEYDNNLDKGKSAIFDLRKNFSDFTMINTFVDQDFTDKYNLFVTGKKLDEKRNVIQYYVKSRKGEDYKKMLIDTLYHPPFIKVNYNKTDDSKIYIEHIFENKQLIKDYIYDTMRGIEFLWGGEVALETTEIVKNTKTLALSYRRVLYTMKDHKLEKNNI